MRKKDIEKLEPLLHDLTRRSLMSGDAYNEIMNTMRDMYMAELERELARQNAKRNKSNEDLLNSDKAVELNALEVAGFTCAPCGQRGTYKRVCRLLAKHSLKQFKIKQLGKETIVVERIK